MPPAVPLNHYSHTRDQQNGVHAADATHDREAARRPTSAATSPLPLFHAQLYEHSIDLL